MSEYINRELLKERFRKRLNWLKKDIHDEYSGALYDCCEYDTKLIDEITAADVAPVMHGRWIHKGNSQVWECSRCGRGVNTNPEGIDLYCYHCGAKMDEKE